MRALPWFVGGVAIAAIGGAVVGEAIDTTPRKIHDSLPLPAQGTGSFAYETHERGPAGDHYPMEMGGRTIEVAELRERGLYSQDRYRAVDLAWDRTDPYADRALAGFDFEAAAAEQRRWEADQDRALASAARSASRPRAVTRTATRRAPELARSVPSQVRYVSQPVVQETSGIAP